ncbi:hypothetical protein D8842_07165 [Streptococcus mitis]|nr:hypothetical protein D8842_07165 [Streptococcus mitis]
MFFWFCLISTVILAYLIGNNSLQSNKWNYGLLLCLLADMYYVGLYLFKNIPTYIQDIVTYLQNMTSSLDVVVLVALITGSITLLNSFYSRYSEQRNKKRAYLATKREGPYSDLFTVIHKVSLSGKGDFLYSNEEMIKDINDFNSKLSLWGSPKVVKKWNDFRQKSLEGNKQLEPKELLNAVEEVMNEMRKDLGSKSTKKGELLSIFINDSENLLRKRK